MEKNYDNGDYVKFKEESIFESVINMDFSFDIADFIFRILLKPTNIFYLKTYCCVQYFFMNKIKCMLLFLK